MIHFLVNTAGKNGNLLLNIGPMPNGKIQPEFVDTLHGIGEWTCTYGESIYGTRGGVINAQEWGTITKKDKTLNVHVLEAPMESYMLIPELKERIKSVTSFDNGTNIKFKQVKEGLFIYTGALDIDSIDTIYKMETR